MIYSLQADIKNVAAFIPSGGFMPCTTGSTLFYN
jgi:hypothetical protein